MNLYPKVHPELDSMPEPTKSELLSGFAASPEMRRIKRRLLIEDFIFLLVYVGLTLILKYPYSLFVHLFGFASCLFAFHRALSKNIETINLLFIRAGQPNHSMQRTSPLRGAASDFES